MSFKTKLEQFIKERHQVSYNELVDFTEKEGHKVETAVRSCRLSKVIKPIKNEKHHITGYKHQEGLSEEQQQRVEEFNRLWPSFPSIRTEPAPKGLF